MVLDQLEKGTTKVGDTKLRAAMKEVLEKEMFYQITCLIKMLM